MSDVIELSPHLQQHLPKDHTFDWLLNMNGKVYRDVKHRRTLDFSLGGRNYFIKVHRGCGWKEIFKDLFSCRLPIVSARSEWQAINRLHALGVPTLTVSGRGERGRNPARRESFIITEALEGMISLADLTLHWGGLTGPKKQELKQALLEKTALIARTIHEHGLNHRDFYLCHFLVQDRDWKEWRPQEPLEIYLIDLHRMQVRSCVPLRWRIKDLGGLFHSSLDCDLTRRDLLRFMRIYMRKSWSRFTPSEKRMWRRVWRNGRKLYLGFHKRPPPSVGATAGC